MDPATPEWSARVSHASLANTCNRSYDVRAILGAHLAFEYFSQAGSNKYITNQGNETIVYMVDSFSMPKADACLELPPSCKADA
jgi:hypothetical protein